VTVYVCDEALYDCVTEADGQRLRVIDYKTGNFQPRPLASLDAIFLQDSLAQHSDYYLQAMLYSCLVRRSTEYNPQNMAVSPALLFIQHAAQENFDPVLYFGKERIADVEPHMASFENLLANVIDEIYNPDLPFAPTADRDRCRTCIYRQLCSLAS
jgi:CRISPR/Cas system-associated exonuclease Cas4 (RecB family)